MEYKFLLRQEKDKLKEKFQKTQTTKLIVAYLLFLLNGIVIYSCVAMWHFKDITYLEALITDIAAQVLVFGIYAIKAYFEKKQEESVKLERDKMKKEADNQ